MTHDSTSSNVVVVVPTATTAPQLQHAVTNSSSVVPGNMPPWSYSAQGPALVTPLAAFSMRQSYLSHIYILHIMFYTDLDKYLIEEL